MKFSYKRVLPAAGSSTDLPEAKRAQPVQDPICSGAQPTLVQMKQGQTTHDKGLEQSRLIIGSVIRTT